MEETKIQICEYEILCPYFKIDCKIPTNLCDRFRKFSANKTVDETCEELGLEDNDFEIITHSIHDSEEYQALFMTGRFREEYAKFFRKHAVSYAYRLFKANDLSA